jgi:hypothetical protein
MTVREIPKSYEYICDVCGKNYIQENAGGHYTDSRPPHWARLVFKQAREDFQGNECADASVELLMCRECRDKAANAINAVKEETNG